MCYLGQVQWISCGCGLDVRPSLPLCNTCANPVDLERVHGGSGWRARPLLATHTQRPGNWYRRLFVYLLDPFETLLRL